MYDFNFIVISGEHSDITIILNGDERIHAHFLVLFARCKEICDQIIEANGSKYLEIWSHLSKKVVLSFLSYLYCGKLDLELDTSDDLDAARYFNHAYPNLEIWRSYRLENYNDQTS